MEDNKEKPIQILSINPINRHGKVESDAKRFKLPYPVLVGRNSDIVKDYGVKSLPRLIIIDKEGKIASFEKYLKAEDIQKILDPLLK